MPGGTYISMNRGSPAAAGGAVVIFLLLAALGLVAYYVYKKPCDLKEHVPKLYKWIFHKSDIDWPKDPKGCTEDPSS